MFMMLLTPLMFYGTVETIDVDDMVDTGDVYGIVGTVVVGDIVDTIDVYDTVYTIDVYAIC